MRRIRYCTPEKRVHRQFRPLLPRGNVSTEPLLLRRSPVPPPTIRPASHPAPFSSRSPRGHCDLVYAGNGLLARREDSTLLPSRLSARIGCDPTVTCVRID